MSYIKADNDKQQRMFDYLEELRQSGDTNMFGATPYLENDFGLDKKTAMAVLGKWMKLHNNPKRLLEKPVFQETPSRMVTRFEKP